MDITYVVITILAALAYSYAACMNFVGAESVKVVAEKVQVSQKWMIPRPSPAPEPHPTSPPPPSPASFESPSPRCCAGRKAWTPLRTDVNTDDLLALLAGVSLTISHHDVTNPGVLRRTLSVVCDGLRPQGRRPMSIAAGRGPTEHGR